LDKGQKEKGKKERRKIKRRKLRKRKRKEQNLEKNYISFAILFFHFITPSLELLCTFAFSLSFSFTFSRALLHPYSLARLPFSHFHSFKLSPALLCSLSFSGSFTLSRTSVVCYSLFFALSHSYLVLSSHTVSHFRTVLFPCSFFFFRSSSLPFYLYIPVWKFPRLFPTYCWIPMRFPQEIKTKRIPTSFSNIVLSFDELLEKY